MSTWHDLGPLEALKTPPLRGILLGKTPIALSYIDGEFSAIGGTCPHEGGPLGRGELKGDKIVCPWHYFSYHHKTGICRLGEHLEFAVPTYELKQENGHLWINSHALTKGKPMPEPQFHLARPIVREAGPVRVVGVSATMMTLEHPRYSTSEDLLRTALDYCEKELGAETRMLKLRELQVRACEGYYSKAAEACIWPCTITRADREDQMKQIYEAFIHWADVILVATPIRWGSASSLYYKMVERMNCIQNQITLHNKVLIQNKVASFIITGGQDNVQMVAGQMLGFFSELGFLFPPFPFIGHSLGWDEENMQRNQDFVKGSASLHEGAKELAKRAVEMSQAMLNSGVCTAEIGRAGRKASGDVDQPKKTSATR